MVIKNIFRICLFLIFFSFVLIAGMFIGVHRSYLLQHVLDIKHFFEDGFYPNRINIKNINSNHNLKKYKLTTNYYSYLHRNEDGSLLRDDNGNFFKDQKFYQMAISLTSSDTAIIVMDPFVGSCKIIGERGNNNDKILQEKNYSHYL